MAHAVAGSVLSGCATGFLNLRDVMPKLPPPRKPDTKCKACEGSGKASNGRTCHPCNGTGERR